MQVRALLQTNDQHHYCIPAGIVGKRDKKLRIFKHFYVLEYQISNLHFMKNKLTATLLLFFILATALNKTEGCDLSSFRLISVSGTGPFTLTTELCIGGGRTGVVNGADAATFDFLFGFFRAAGTINVLSFSPAFATSPATGCRMDGFDIGPTPFAPFESQASIYYAWDPSTYPACSNGFQCISSTALCGNASTLCLPFTFVTDVLPDSVMVFGIEGAGNPVAGCYSNPDMGFSLIPLSLQGMNATGSATSNSEALIEWTSVIETEADYFEVEKAMPDDHQHLSWHTLKRVTTNGAANGNEYRYRDDTYNGKESYYRILQKQKDGSSRYSNVIKIAALRQKDEVWIFPNPARGQVRIKATNLQSATLLDCWGRQIQTQLPDAAGMCRFSTDQLAAGIYFVRILNREGEVQLEKLIVK